MSGPLPAKKIGRPGKVSTCHPEVKHAGKGLCKDCYHAKYRLETKEIRKIKDLARNAREQTPFYKQQKYEALVKRKYGVTKELLNEMYSEQNSLCKICNKPPNVNKKLHVDHCHTTGKIRGLLCAQCNWFLGKVDRDPNVLKNLIKYEETNGR